MSPANPKQPKMSDIQPAKPSKLKAVEEPIIYLEADEEITAATSRMLASESNEVRIVVPKRSTLLQSIVNQKLLKRAADNAGKTLILVTTDRTATHLAGQIGLAVASSVKAQAEVPQAGDAPEIDNSDIVEAAAPVVAAAVATKAASTPKPAYAKPMSKIQPRINNPFGPAADAIEEPDVSPQSLKPAKNKKSGASRVPDFGGLQKRALIIAGVVGTVILAFVAQFYLKQATVTLYAAGQIVDVNTNFKVDTNATAVSITSATIPGRSYELSRDLSGSGAATGKKDVGTKASGTMTIKNSYDSNPHKLVAGTRFVSGGGLVFTSTADVTVPGSSVSGGQIVAGSASVAVQAAQNGDSYNLAPTTYSIPGLPASQQALIKGNGSQMSGGTTKEIKVVAQADVDKITSDAIEKDKDDAAKELRTKLHTNQLEMTDSFKSQTANVVASPDVDAEGDTVSVKFKVTYSLLAVQRDDLKTLISAVIQKQVGNDKQVYEDGINDARITAKDGAFNFASSASAGKKIDTAALIEQIKGKRTGAATDIARTLPGVSRATISLSPAWSVKLPSIADHIDVQIKVEQSSN